MTELPSSLLKALQARAARSSVGPSSMRGAGSRGVVGAGRPYLCQLKLRRFATSSEPRFGHELDRATEGLMRAFPRSARHWGLARKGLNIFLRECLYTVYLTVYLRDAHNLGVAEAFFELPLDSLTGLALHKASPLTVPTWTTVRGLDRPLSDQFQQAASFVASTRGFAWVHLDAVWWGQRE